MKKIVFSNTAFDEYNQWSVLDKKKHKKIIKLIEDIQRHPFDGIGKPEPLKHNLKGWWSRHIDNEHRLVYKINDLEIEILSCKYHY